jgi:hypothetical protein
VTFKAAARAALVPFSFLLAIGAIVPTRHDFNVITEYSFVMALHEAFVRGLNYGSDVAITFGPWGFLLGAFHPETLVLAVLARLAFALLAGVALWKRVAAQAGTVAAALMIAALAFIVHICWSDAFFYFLPILILFEGFEPGSARRNNSAMTRGDRGTTRSPLFLPLVGAGALLSLTKFSFLTMMIVVVTVLSLDEVRRRRFPWSAVVYAGALASFWVLARQRAADLLPFLRDGLELSMCNGEAGGMASPLYEPRTFLPFVAAAILFTIVLVTTELRTGVARGLLFASGWLGTLLIVFKAGFVRADFFHVAPATGALLLAQLLYLAVRSGVRPRWIRAASMIPILLSTWALHALVDRGFVSDAIDTVTDSTTAVVRMLAWPSFRQEVAAVHGAFLASQPPPPRALRGDSVPGPAPLIFHPRFTWEPRPVFQSYCVCTRELGARNLRWLRTAQPPTIVFNISPIDRQFPPLQDGALWPEYLAHYAVDGQLGSHLLLTRRSGPPAGLLRPARTVRAQLGQQVTLPTSTQALRFARIRVSLSARGTILRTFYKTPPLFLRVRLDDGSEKRYRFIRGMAENPFLISPLVDDRDAFASLMQRGANLRSVTSFMIESDDPRAYVPEYEIELSDWLWQ